MHTLHSDSSDISFPIQEILEVQTVQYNAIDSIYLYI